MAASEIMSGRQFLIFARLLSCCRRHSEPATELMGSCSAEQALDSTVIIAEFIKRGHAIQQAVDAIIEGNRLSTLSVEKREDIEKHLCPSI
jgi:hypothetical protein